MPLRAALHALDTLVRWSFRVREFTRDPECILRIGPGRSSRDVALADGTVVRSGELVADLHLWNEQLPKMPRDGPGLAWGATMARRLVGSLRELARAAGTDPLLVRVRAVRAVGALTGTGDVLDARGLLRRLGFEVEELDPKPGPWRRFATFWQHLWSTALVWTYNAPSVRTRNLLRMRRVEVWISKAELTRRYG